MAKDKFPGFESSNAYIVDKDKALDNYIRYMLLRTQSMFVYEGLPDTIPQKALEKLLQTKGYCFITRHEGELYALHGGLGGELDVYEEPTQITVANSALNLSKTYDLEKDGVLFNSDSLRMGILPILQKYGALLVENTLSMRTIDIMLRMVCFISAGDDKTQRGAEKFIQDIVNGKISAIAESAFFDGVRVQSVSNSQNYLHQFIEYEQYIKASCFNEIGLNANYNMKREYVGSNESTLNDDFLLPLVDNMLKCRAEAIEKINEMFDTEISIDLAGPWKAAKAENEKQVSIAEAVSDGLESGVPTEMSVNENSSKENGKPVVQLGDISNVGDGDKYKPSTGSDEAGIAEDTEEGTGTSETEDGGKPEQALTDVETEESGNSEVTDDDTEPYEKPGLSDDKQTLPDSEPDEEPGLSDGKQALPDSKSDEESGVSVDKRDKDRG